MYYPVGSALDDFASGISQIGPQTAPPAPVAVAPTGPSTLDKIFAGVGSGLTAIFGGGGAKPPVPAYIPIQAAPKSSFSLTKVLPFVALAAGAAILVVVIKKKPAA